MWAELLDELRGRGAGVVIWMLIGTIGTGIVAIRKRRTERRNILHGDARDTVVIAQHVIESEDVPATDTQPSHRQATRMRIRSLGQAPLESVIPNGHLASELIKRAHRVSARNTLIAMDGAEGSYLLESLTNFICDRVANHPFAHDLYVMAPCCEPAGLVVHQPVTILLIRLRDLELFEQWETCCDLHVEHGADGARVLTLMELAKRFRQETALLAHLRETGQRTRYRESMYLLDLTLDQSAAPIATKPVPWDRFTPILEQMMRE
jgi:hypothetical protein